VRHGLLGWIAVHVRNRLLPCIHAAKTGSRVERDEAAATPLKQKGENLVAVLKPPAKQQCRRALFQVKKVRITYFSFVFSTFFTRSPAHRIDSQRFATTAPAKVAAQKRPNRAGATPLFCGRAAQKFLGVAPALPGISRRRFARCRGGAKKISCTLY